MSSLHQHLYSCPSSYVQVTAVPTQRGDKMDQAQSYVSGYPAPTHREHPPRFGYSNAFDTVGLSPAVYSVIHPYNTTPGRAFPDTSTRSAFTDYFNLIDPDIKPVEPFHPYDTILSNLPLSRNRRKGSSSSATSISQLSTDGSVDSFESYPIPSTPPSLEFHNPGPFIEEGQLFEFLSPRQTLVLQEAHKEAQRRANSDSISPLPFQNAYIDALVDGVAPSTFSPALNEPQASVYRAMPLIRPTPTRPAIDTALFLSREVEAAPPISYAVQVDPISTSPPPSSTSKAVSQQRSKQLGSFPADEAFSSSLDQLSSCGNDKPPFLWWTLIRAAILGAPLRKLPMDLLCSSIASKFPYFSNKNSPNWKSSIRSVIHTKPCFQKTEDKEGTVWWSVLVDIDPREQRRGLKKRSNSESRGHAGQAATVTQFTRRNSRVVVEEGAIAEDTEDDGDETDDAAPVNYTRKRRRTG